MTSDVKNVTDTYPVSKTMTVNFSPLEDRLIIRAPRLNTTPLTLLLTRRMTMLVLKQLLDRLAGLSELGKTPGEYWQEVLQMTHQQALVNKQLTDQERLKEAAQAAPEESQSSASELYLATELTVQVNNKQLVMAFKGLPMPDAMLEGRRHTPVMAMPLQVDNVHQLIELLINRAREAEWHLPVELPWLKPEIEQPAEIRSN